MATEDIFNLIDCRDLTTRQDSTRYFGDHANFLWEHSRLDSVICRGVESTSLPDTVIQTPIPLNNTIPKFFAAINKFGPLSIANGYNSKKLFDYFASQIIESENCGNYLFTTPGLIKTVEAIEGQLIVRGTTEFAPSMIHRVREEAESTGIEPNMTESFVRLCHDREKSLKEAQGIIALSNFVKQSFVDGGIDKEKIKVVNLGVKTDLFPQKREYKEDEFRVLFVGADKLRKGIMYLINTWKKCGWSNDQNAELRIIGPGTENIEHLYDDDSNINVLGKVDNIVKEYQEATVFALPSLSEGFVRTAVEAMSVGTPVIVTPNCGTTDIMEHKREGFSVPIKNSKKIADALQYFRDNPSEVKRMGQNAARTARNHNWENYMNELTNYIDTLNHTERL